MTDNDKILIEFLNKCGIVFQHFDNLNGMIIPRDVLISVEKYEKVKEEIKNIKKIFSSSSLTSLQTKAKGNQKWPLLNLVRQILKQKDYLMKPMRKSAGYNEQGQKKYIRSFQLQKITKLNIKV
jgi:hypothetical protein